MQLGKIWLKTLKTLHLISETTYRRGKIKYIPHINKQELQKQIDNFQGSGITDQPRFPKLIVSLTSFPERMYDIHFTLYSLLNQTLKPDAVILWLAEEQFPNKDKDIPQDVLNLQKNGLTIKWCKDLRSYKKLIPALAEFPKDVIVTADDDIYYPSSWLELLYTGYLRNPRAIHCHRGHKIQFDKAGQILPYKKWKHRISHDFASFHNFFTGAGGILYPPRCLHKDVSDPKLFQLLAPNADDIWFWSMAIINGTAINIVDNNLKQLIYVNPERELKLTSEITLAMVNTSSGQNDQQLKQIMKHYPQLATFLN